MIDEPRIFPLGEGALTVDFGGAICGATNDRVMSLAAFLDRNPFAGLVEIVPAYNSLTVFFDVVMIRRNFRAAETAFAAVENLVRIAVQTTGEKAETESRTIEIPICFAAEFAPDLEFVAAINNLPASEVVEIFLKKTYRVFMLGFLPGFAYMGEVDEKIAAPRRETPRVKVPAGSVGIAGRQTGIYPFDSPGGWQIIGRTDAQMFDFENEPPTLLQAGDAVRFVANR